ncbi:MAG: DNA-directed RNA polymerase subunit omega [Armatimonadota bacterium]|nr:DNA-directed RNA polymerase subunit omega [bacterium]MCS7310756.1 DNA-directed RNA polymerase subunit omega [Armatimonadota bacterium]MDW8105140.1 DNA-directed RNA polymerase subunit omega [Armatimonadota bacterium]MDW8290899.1 DNA-directed RNA polymerase subunit omega [Armatimonadota bacterium]
MILPNPDQLNRFNKYALVMLAAKRAKQLQEQGIARRALVNSSSQNPLTIALEEIAGGRLIPSFNPEPLPDLVAPEPAEPVLTTEEFEEAIAKMTMAAEANRLDTDNGTEPSAIETEYLAEEGEELFSEQAEEGEIEAWSDEEETSFDEELASAEGESVKEDSVSETE